MSEPLVYLFEDDPSLRRLLAEVLEDELGAKVVACADVADVRTRCGSEPPDVIVADFWGTSHMALKETERSEIAALGQLAPLVLVSARGWVRQVDPEELGVAGLVPKPLELEEFVGVVRDAMAPADQAESLPPREALSVFLLPGL